MAKAFRKLIVKILFALAVSLVLFSVPVRPIAKDTSEPAAYVVTVSEENVNVPERKPVSFMEGFAAVFVLLLLWLWIAVFRKVKPYL